MLLNLSLLITCTFLVSLTYREWPVARRRAEHLLRLGLAAVAVLLLTVYGVTTSDGVRLDFRFVPIALVALRYGPLAGLAVALPMLGLRALEAPFAALVALVSTLSVLALSRLISPRVLLETPQWRRAALLPLPFLGIGLGMLLVPRGRGLFAVAYPSMLLLNALGLGLALLVLHARFALLRANDRLHSVHLTDELTGLGNRRRFELALSDLQPGEALVLLDLDAFGTINARHGEAAGDRALRYLAQLLAEFAPDHAYRLGGDEFALLPAGGERGAREITAAVLRRVAEPGGLPWSALTVSAGLAVRGWGERPSELRHRADEALFRAKTNGGDRLAVAPARGRRSGLGGTLSGLPAQDAADEAPPRYTLWRSQRATVDLLTQRRTLTPDDWTELLRQAIGAVDGAEAGSLTVREGQHFRVYAQHGFAPELVGQRSSEEHTMRWYGEGLESWRAGTPRVRRGAEIHHTGAWAEAPGAPPGVAEVRAWGRTAELRATLCVPVPLNGEVVAHLNLDSFSSEAAFDGQAALDTKLFAQQLAALLQLQERWQELDVLGQLHHELDADDPGAETRLTALAVELLRASHALLLRYEAPDDRLVSVVMRGSARPTPALTLPRGQGVCWAALRAGVPLRVPDVRRVDIAQLPEDLDSDDAALMVVPLLSRSREPLGALAISRSVHRPYQPSDEGLGAMLASVGARVLERQAHLAETRATLEAALNTLGVALEARDFETQGHTRRVTELAARLADALGLSEERRMALRHGAALHDIGKLCIPDAVLLKPGRLTPEEYAVVQQHAPLGADLAARIPHMHPEAHGVVRSHHERWDGTGYPDRLGGTEIPLLARIFALCDVYDALTSERPYKAAMSPCEALGIIEAGSGSQFDPVLTALFVELLRGAAQVGAPGAAAS